MNTFTDTTKQAYELYNSGKVKQALSLLTPGTQHHDYLKLLETLKTGKEKEYKQSVNEYFTRYNQYSSDELFDEVVSKMVQLGHYDFLKELASNNLSMSFNHSKPYYAINTMEKDSEVSLGAS